MYRKQMICFTKEALARVTPAQITKMVNLNYPEIRVSVDFSLPNGYIYVIMTHGTTSIHGGIDPDGEMST